MSQTATATQARQNALSALASVLVLSVTAVSGSAAEPPPQMVEAAESAFALCAASGGVANILAGYRTDADLNGDDVTDFITDLSQMECVGAWQTFCHSVGCPVTVWLSQSGGGHSRFPLGDLRGFTIDSSGQGLPVLIASYDSSLCADDLVETTTCSRSWIFDSNAPETPDFDLSSAEAPEPRSADRLPVPQPQPAGWTLRQVPGASPLALGSGTGNLASISAFCLLDAPFIAVRFANPPANPAVTLTFAFSRGTMDVEALQEATAGGAFVIDLAEQPLAARLAGRDSAVDLSIDGDAQGTLSLRGSTRALRTALGDCYTF